MDNSKTVVASSRPRIYYGWWLVAVSWIALAMGGATAVSIYFKPMLDEFGWDRASLSLVGGIALLLIAGVSPFFGRLIDRFGPRMMLFVTISAQALSSLINSLASGIEYIYFVRFLAEIRPSHSTGVLINRWFAKKRGRALGIVATGFPVGMLVFSPFSQYLVEVWGWRWTLLFWTGISALGVLPLTLIVRNSPEEKGLLPDGEMPTKQGSLALVQSRSDNTAVESLPGVGKSMAEVVRMAPFWLLSGAQFICGIGCGLMLTHTVIFAQDLGYSAMIGASFLSVQGGANLIGVLVTGQMSDQIARNKVLSATHFIRALSFSTIAVAIIAGGGPLWLLYVAMALFGFGFFTTAPLNSGLIADFFGQHRMGTILGITLASHIIGMAIGTYAGGLTFQLTGSYFYIFFIQGILELLAAMFAFAIK